MRMTANVRPLDGLRAHRLMIAWSEGDKLALDAVLGETMADPIGTPGLLFALTEFATALGEQVTTDFTDQLRSHLLAAQAEDDQP
jgi:hypothetical protein